MDMTPLGHHPKLLWNFEIKYEHCKGNTMVEVQNANLELLNDEASQNRNEYKEMQNMAQNICKLCVKNFRDTNVYYEASTQKYDIRPGKLNKMCQVDANKISDMNHVEMKVTKHLLRVKSI